MLMCPSLTKTDIAYVSLIEISLNIVPVNKGMHSESKPPTYNENTLRAHVTRIECLIYERSMKRRPTLFYPKVRSTAFLLYFLPPCCQKHENFHPNTKLQQGF